jgi:phage terminase large subunit
MTTQRIELPPKLIPVFAGTADTRGAWGGRGSAKTRSFAKMTAVRTYMWSQEGREGIILCGRQYMNSLADSSLEEVKAAIQSEPWLAEHFEIGEKFVKTRDGRISYTFSGLDRNIDSIKSKARILLGWVDEAEPVLEEAWQKLIPTLREEDSELWVTWNPERKNSDTHKRFRLASQDPLTKIVEMNWRDNPWFPKILERKRLKDLEERPDSYNHIWEGDFVTVMEGAYYAQQLTAAKSQGRIGRVAADPLLPIRLVADIGGTGRLSDNFVFWAVQFVGREIRWLNHYEVQGQEIGHHMNWMRGNKYTPERAQIILPHDGSKPGDVYNISYQSAFESAGFDVEVIENQGPGAAMLRVEALRRVFPMCWFNEETTRPGIDALGWYHEKIDAKRNFGLGPDHDWSSHSADAAGLVAVAYEEPEIKRESQSGSSRGIPGGWMG